MSWQIHINSNHEETSECCLQLRHSDKNHTFRSWFGPLAKLIYLQLQSKFNLTDCGHTIQIEKQFAQYTLMHASFIHQRCMYQYQITNDLKLNNLSDQHDLAELLLFIRMTCQHPTERTLIACVQTQMPWCDEVERAIDALIETKLIQKIVCTDHVFYDKNPYPHDHVFDLKEHKLNDFNDSQKLNRNQRLVVGSLNGF